MIHDGYWQSRVNRFISMANELNFIEQAINKAGWSFL